MLPYAFTALTMRAVGVAAYDMMNFIIEDFRKREKAEEESPPRYIEPDYQGCIELSTAASI